MKLYTHSRLYYIIAVLLKPLLGISNSTFLGCVEESNNTRCFTVYHDGETDRSKASRSCRERGSYLASINNQEVASLVNSSLHGRAWISLMLSQDVNMGHWWRSVNQSVGTDDDLLAGLANSSFPSCLTFSADNEFSAEPCTEKHGFICSSALEPNNNVSGGCVENVTCYIIVNSTGASWYGARSYCRIRHGGDLLAPQFILNDNISSTARSLGANKLQLWMGASNAMYNWQPGDGASVREVFFSNWAPTHPIDNYDCAVVNLINSMWESVPCTGVPYAYVCESAAPAMDSTVNGHQLPIMSTVAPTMTSEDSRHSWWFYVAVISGCLVVIIIVAIIICVLVIGRKKKKRNEAVREYTTSPVATTGLPLTRSPYEDVPDFTSNEMRSVATMATKDDSVIHNAAMNGTRTSSSDEIPLNGIQYKISKDGDLYALPGKVSSNGVQSQQWSNESEEENGETGVQLFDQGSSHSKESQDRGKEGADCEGQEMKSDTLSENREDTVSDEEGQDIYKEGQDIANGETNCDTGAPEIKEESPKSTGYNRDSKLESEVDSQRSQQSDDDEQESEKGNLEENDGEGHYCGGLRNI